MTHRPVALRVLALMMPLALLAPAAAHAEEVVTEDAVGDVVRKNDDVVVSAETPTDPAAPRPDYVPAPDNETADITRTVVDHRARVLVVAASVRDLDDRTSDFVFLRIRTPQRGFIVLVERRGRHTYTSWANGSACAGTRTIASSRDDRITVRVPTGCLGAPGSVRVAVGLVSASVTHDPHTGDSMDRYIDDAFAGGLGASGDRLTLGPEVRRG